MTFDELAEFADPQDWSHEAQELVAELTWLPYGMPTPPEGFLLRWVGVAIAVGEIAWLNLRYGPHLGRRPPFIEITTGPRCPPGIKPPQLFEHLDSELRDQIHPAEVTLTIDERPRTSLGLRADQSWVARFTLAGLDAVVVSSQCRPEQASLGPVGLATVLAQLQGQERIARSLAGPQSDS